MQREKHIPCNQNTVTKSPHESSLLLPFGHFQLETKGNILIRYLRLEMSIVNFLVELSREKDRNTQKYGRSRNKTTRYY